VDAPLVRFLQRREAPEHNPAPGQCVQSPDFNNDGWKARHIRAMMPSDTISMSDLTNEYRHRSDDELLQLWVERSQLSPEARSLLHNEIQKRSLTNEAASATDVWATPPERKLAPPVNSYLGLSVPWFWLREVWLRFQSRHGISVEAEVESAHQTQQPIRSSARAELRYSYIYEGNRYSGRTVRDFVFSRRAADALAFDHKRGDVITVRVDPTRPTVSFFPSGFGWLGWVDAFWSGALGLIMLLCCAMILLASLGRL